MNSPRGPLPRLSLAPIPAAVHGALDYAELQRHQLAPDAVIDFSENSNPFGPAPGVRAALAALDPARYPDRESLALRHLLAAQTGADLAEIIVGNGAAELLWLVAFAFLAQGDRVLILGPTFGEYARMAQLMGAEVVQWRAMATDFAVDPTAVAQQIETVQPKVLFLCNPNNPTGTVIDPAIIAAWANPAPQTLFVVDEAYLAFVPGLRSMAAWQLPNVLVVRSLTKEYALAGLRLGYAVGPTALVAALAQARVPWSVNAAAQAAGLAALADQQHLQETLAALQCAKAEFVSNLQRLGLSPLPSQTHYFLLNVGDGAAFRQHLLPYGLLVRDCASFGLPAYVRIATHKPLENQALLSHITQQGMKHAVSGVT
ncbi:MAG: histidinol-phosphate aminotransferase family protein [Caldilineaceae bacterium]|nr:histidinol-phosphate aminotransferase family protein [Caldilineaceae bacterium]